MSKLRADVRYFKQPTIDSKLPRSIAPYQVRIPSQVRVQALQAVSFGKQQVNGGGNVLQKPKVQIEIQVNAVFVFESEYFWNEKLQKIDPALHFVKF